LINDSVHQPRTVVRQRGQRRLRRLGENVGFAEGPVFTSDDEVVFTSIDLGCVYRIGARGTEVFAVTGGGPNGAAEGDNGLIYIAQNGGRKPAHRWPSVTGGVQVVGRAGRVEWLTQDPVSPNDLCFGPDGYLYVTDPTRRAERDDGRIWRCDVATGEAELLVSVPWYPNGIAFGPEDDAIYVASTGQSSIVRFALTGYCVGPPEIAVRLAYGYPDGLAFDSSGNLVIAAVGPPGHPGEIQTFSLSGDLLDTFRPGTSTKYTNVAFADENVLLVTDASGGAVLAVEGWPVSGLPLHPFRNRRPQASHSSA
jgi:gluconolactonase